MWRQIRSDALAACGEGCSACGEVTPGGKYMVCDELWDYDEQHGVATLTGVRILCPACDFARHFARAGQLGKGADALATLARVNGISTAQARALQDEALAQWRRRSRRAWTVRVGREFLRRYPVLDAVDGQRGAGFSLARRTTRRTMPGLVGGRPGLRRLLVSYFLAISLRCHASSVAGVTGKTSPQRLRGTSRASAANQARSAYSYRMRPTRRRSSAFSCWSTSSSASFAKFPRNTRTARLRTRHVSK